MAGMRDTWLHRLVRGEYGLARTYWIGWWLGDVGAALPLFLMMFVAVILQSGTGTALAWVCGFLIYGAYNVVAMIGVWRAADAYRGWRGWAIWAKVNIGLACIGLAFLAVCLPFVFVALSDS